MSNKKLSVVNESDKNYSTYICRLRSWWHINAFLSDIHLQAWVPDDAKIRHGRTGLGTSRRRGMLGDELHRTHDRDQGQNWIYPLLVGRGAPRGTTGREETTETRKRKVLGSACLKRPQNLKYRDLENEDIFEIIKNPSEMGAVRIFEKSEFWDTTAGLIKVETTQGIATIHLQ